MTKEVLVTKLIMKGFPVITWREDEVIQGTGDGVTALLRNGLWEEGEVRSILHIWGGRSVSV